MKAANLGTLTHVGVLALSVAAAVGVWTRDKEPKALAGDVPVWSGHGRKTRKVTVDARKDAAGRYFVGSLERDATPPPHAADAGAPPPAGPRTTLGFVSVGPGDKLAEALGPLKALRALGKVGDDRAAEFGLAEPEATVTVKVGGVEHKLLLGATTPGGGDRYAREAASGEVYVLKGDPLRNLESADSLLLERDLHEWKDTVVARARVTAGGKARELTRGGPENKRFWADAQSPETNDETLGNWMSKLDRLRPTEFVARDPEPRETLLRVDYTGKGALGFVEVIKVVGHDSADKPSFYLRTEHTRLFGKVVGSLAEQLEQDLGTIVK
jgi:Domain of unknown function (DUF4340)